MNDFARLSLLSVGIVVGASLTSFVSAETSQTGMSVALLRGDADGDGNVSVTDALVSLNHVFGSGRSLPCQAAADSNGDSELNLADGLHLLNFLFLDQSQPAAPFPECAASIEALSCEEQSCESSETSVPETFELFGNSYEASSVVFVVGPSCTMPENVRVRVHEELTRTISQFPPSMEFAMVHFTGDASTGTAEAFSVDGRHFRATADVVRAAHELLTEKLGDGGEGEDLVAEIAAALDIASQASGQRKLVIYIGDAFDRFWRRDAHVETPAQTQVRLLETINSRNADGLTQVHTIGVGDYSRAQHSILVQIAIKTGGSFLQRGTTAVRPARDPVD